MKRKALLICLVVVLTAGLLLAACAKPAPAPTPAPAPALAPAPAPTPITLKFTNHIPKVETSHALAAIWFTEEVERRTDGRVKFEIYWGGSLLSIREALEGIETGIADAGEVAAGVTPDLAPLHTVCSSFPFVTGNPVTFMAFVREAAQKFPEYREEVERFNQIVVSEITLGPYGLASQTPIKTLDDLKGKKIGAFGRAAPKWLVAAGATAVNVPGPEVYEALQKGVIDGRLFGVGDVVGNSIYDVAKCFNKVGFGMLAGGPLFTINKDVWEKKLSKDEREIILQVGIETGDRTARLVEEELASQEQFIQEKGMQIIEFPKEAREKWANLPAVRETGEEWIKGVEEKGLPGREIAELWLKYRD